MECLNRGEVDLAFGVFPQPPDNLVRTRLFTERFIGIARTDHPRIGDGAVDLDAFVTLPHALVSVRRDERGPSTRRSRVWGCGAGLPGGSLHALASEGPLRHRHDAIVPERAARTVVGPAIRTFELPFETAAWPVDMLWNPSARADQATAWLRSLIVETARAL